MRAQHSRAHPHRGRFPWLHVERRSVRRCASSLVLCTGVGLSLSLAGCEITAQDQPQVVVATAFPHISPTAEAGVGGDDSPGVDLSVQVYLVRGRQLARVTRLVRSGVGLGPVLRALGQPARPDEVRAGLHTSLPESATALRGVLSQNGTATVTLPAGMDRLSVLEQQTAAAQIVFTVTADSLATRVQLVSGGLPVPVPDADGHLIERPLTRADYASLAGSG